MNLNPATSDLIDRMNRNAATYERDFQLYVPALTRDGHSLLMSELEHFWSMTDRSYSFGNRAIELLNTLRLDGVQPNMNYYVWADGAEDDLRDGLLVLLTSVINDELSEDCPPLANLVNVNIYKSKVDGFSISYL